MNNIRTTTVYNRTMKRIFSISGLTISLLAVLLTTYTMYVAQIQLVSPFRITISGLCFGVVFLISAFSLRRGIFACLFILPLLPNLTFQILAFTGYGRILDQNTPGLDAVAGLVLGSLVNRCFINRYKSPPYLLPWPGGLLIIFIVLSTALAIFRNLNQSESVGSLSILIYNLVHFRSLGWHHDYRPLFDCIAYANAFALIAVLVSAIKDMPDKNDVIFKPILIGIIVSALLGIIQSQTGKGLQPLQVFFRNDSLGFIALGFQPDIHAFAAHMLIGTVGILGYLYYEKNLTYRIAIGTLIIPLAWTGLLLSKSKASLAISVTSIFFIGLIWFIRQSRHFNKILILSAVTIVFITFSVFIFTDTWKVLITNLIHKFGFADINSLNIYMAYRPEIFIAGLRMFSAFPFLGLGQGEFYRLSANYPFSQSSFLSSTVNGENAHNYFLQVLVENGVIGIYLFCFFIIFPILLSKNKKHLIPALFGLGSVFLGNIYSHSLLVRENFFIASAFIALAYAWAFFEPTSHNKKTIDYFKKNKTQAIVLGCICLTLITMTFLEVKQSFKKFPFKSDKECFIAKPLTEDGWTSGIYEKRLDKGVISVRLNFNASQPDVEEHPLKGSISILHEKFGSLASKEISITKSGPSFIEIDLLPGFAVVAENHKLVLKLQRCYVPPTSSGEKNMRPIGVQIDSVDTKK